MPRILLVNSRYRPPHFRGGVERYIDVLGKALRRLGQDCEIVALEEPIPCNGGVPHRFLDVPAVPFLRPLLFGWMGRLLWASADLIVLQYAPLGILMPKQKLVCTVHTTGYGEARALRRSSKASVRHGWHWLRRVVVLPMERYVYRRARAIVAISAQIAEELVVAYGVRRENLRVIGNGVDCTEFQPDTAVKGRSPFRLLYVGRLARRKNVDLLIEAVSKCTARVELRIVGAGPERPTLEALTSDLNMGERITFCGHRKGSELLAEYQWADLLVMPSSYEGVPLVSLEAKAAGLAIIAADFAGASHLVPADSGWIVKDVTPERLAIAIDESSRDFERLNRMSSCARKEALETYSWNAVIGNLSSYYDSVLRQASFSR